MCGIIAVVRRPSTRTTPASSEVLDLVSGLAASLINAADPTSAFDAAGTSLAAADALLRGVPGLRLMVAEPGLSTALIHHCDEILAAVEAEERRLEQDGGLSTRELEARNEALIAVRDGAWAITRDRLRAATVVDQLSGGATSTDRKSVV